MLVTTTASTTVAKSKMIAVAYIDIGALLAIQGDSCCTAARDLISSEDQQGHMGIPLL